MKTGHSTRYALFTLHKVSGLLGGRAVPVTPLSISRWALPGLQPRHQKLTQKASQE